MDQRLNAVSDLPVQGSMWQPRSASQLLADQLLALSLWNQARPRREQAATRFAESREQRVEAGIHLDALDREHAALLARAASELEQGRWGFEQGRPRAVVAHRQEWFRDRVSAQLSACGAVVVASVDDGAEAVAAVVYEQPDLLVLEERLPTRTGLEVLEQARALSPLTAVAVQSADSGSADALLDAGAAVVCSRQVPPSDLATELMSALGRRETSRALA